MRLTIAFLALGVAYAQAPMKALNPKVQKVVDEVSPDRVAALMQRLEGFGTRNLFSSQTDPKRGIGAAARWIRDEMASYSPRLQVRLDEHDVKKAARVFKDVHLMNVVAVLPGTTQKDRYVLITGHYDSLNIIRKKEGEIEKMDQEGTVAADAPGVSDDGSGTAAVMELARVLSQHEFEKTLVFVAFAGEEYGLVGSNLYAKRSAADKQIIDAVLNNDIIGNDLAGNGRTANSAVRLFSEDPIDSPSRTLARYVKEIGERYVPSMKVNLVFRADRFARGGDHTPFDRAGFPAVRFTTTAEYYANQHSATDTFANASPKYTASVAKLNAAVAASLALAPPAPDISTKNQIHHQRPGNRWPQPRPRQVRLRRTPQMEGARRRHRPRRLLRRLARLRLPLLGKGVLGRPRQGVPPDRCIDRRYSSRREGRRQRRQRKPRQRLSHRPPVDTLKGKWRHAERSSNWPPPGGPPRPWKRNSNNRQHSSTPRNWKPSAA